MDTWKVFYYIQQKNDLTILMGSDNLCLLINNKHKHMDGPKEMNKESKM